MKTPGRFLNYVSADVGSIAGGWLSSALLKRGRDLNEARKTAMLACAICVAPMLLAPVFHTLWVTVTLISLAAAGHQGWSANLFTLPSDTFPRRAVASVVGIGRMAGGVGNMIVSATVATSSRSRAATTRRSSWRLVSHTCLPCS